eukprot:GHVU01211454.1.p1 GENE.GHVU01211454.1~~GHVU01211454.1.p1  ORF type:complete len:425 (-),score=20.73 GHVU01211454.1:238-1512(-)
MDDILMDIYGDVEPDSDLDPLQPFFQLFLLPLVADEIATEFRSRGPGPGYSRPRMVWAVHLEHLMREAQGRFAAHYRMELEDFMFLVALLEPHIRLRDDMARVSCGQDAISPVITVHCMIRWLAGGAMEDIRVVAGISKTSFYRCVSDGMRAVLLCQPLEFHFPSTAAEIDAAAFAFRQQSEYDVVRGCVAAVDGWLCETPAPQRWEAMNQTNYFSGHYHCYGVSVIAACDARCRFVDFCVAQPGAANDMRSYRNTDLPAAVEALPRARFVVGDNGFVCTNKMLTPFGGSNLDPFSDSYNFYHSQTRIRIEQTFGYMTTKWGILRHPLRVNLSHIGLVLLCIARLHNYVITRRNIVVTDSDIEPLYHPSSRHPYRRGFLPSPGGVAPAAGSTMRQVIVEKLTREGILRPGRNARRNQRPAGQQR